MRNIWRYLIAATIIVLIIYAIGAIIVIGAREREARGCDLGHECDCKETCEKAGFEVFSYSQKFFTYSCYCIKDGESVRIG